MEFLLSIQSLSLGLLLLGIALAFAGVRLSGWVLGWILLTGALLLQGFRSMLSYLIEHGGVDNATYAIVNDWMGLGFSLLIVGSMHMMREVFARHRLAEERLRVIGAAAQDAIIMMDQKRSIAFWNEARSTSLMITVPAETTALRAASSRSRQKRRISGTDSRAASSMSVWSSSARPSQRFFEKSRSSGNIE